MHLCAERIRHPNSIGTGTPELRTLPGPCLLHFFISCQSVSIIITSKHFSQIPRHPVVDGAGRGASRSCPFKIFKIFKIFVLLSMKHHLGDF
jgi:hypothetical protein